MAFTTTLTKRLGLRHPIIQAPLAGGGDTPELIAAVSEAGAFGFIGAAYLTPPQILEAARAVRARTERPFGVSLFAPLRAPEVPKHPELALTRLAPYYAELGLTPPEIPALKPDAFPAQFAAALESPASGGIMDGRGIAAALALGASAVQMGTAFLTCDEAGIPQAYKDAILSAHENATRVTRAFSGRPARGIANRFMTEMEASGRGDHILPFPLQNTLTRPLRTAAAQQGRAEYLSLWAGQGLRLARRQSASELVARLERETMEILERLTRTEAKPRRT